MFSRSGRETNNQYLQFRGKKNHLFNKQSSIQSEGDDNDAQPNPLEETMKVMEAMQGKKTVYIDTNPDDKILRKPNKQQ